MSTADERLVRRYLTAIGLGDVDDDDGVYVELVARAMAELREWCPDGAYPEALCAAEDAGCCAVCDATRILVALRAARAA